MALFSKKSSKLSRYQDPTGEFDNRQLKRAEWYAKHRVQLRNALIAVLSAWCVITIGLSLVLWVKYLSYDVWRDNRNLALQTIEFNNFRAIQQQYSALPLQFGQSVIFQSNENKYDFVTPATNPNERFIARIFYHYSYAGGETPQQTMILLPSMQAPLFVLGHETDGGFPSRGRLVVDDIIWKRINAHSIPDLEGYMNDRLDLPVQDFSFAPENAAEGFFSPQISFLLGNNTVYSYWELPLHIELLRGGQLIGALYTTVDQFRAGEERDIELFLHTNISSVDTIRVTPVINIFDPSVYIKPGT